MSKAFGEQTPLAGEDPVSWQTWSDGAGGIPNVTGNINWGKLSLQLSGAEGRSAVYDLGSAHNRTFTLTENRYGTGAEIAFIEIRGDTVSFLQDATSPTWELYGNPIVYGYRYVQVRARTFNVYHVDATLGNDANAGTLGLPWQTFANINGGTFNPGDHILLKRGEHWHEKLVPPSSGAAGYNIVFGAYGSGALPTIDTPVTADDCIDVLGLSYVTIRDIIVTGAGAGGWKSGVVVDANSHHINLTNIESYSNNYYGFHINSSNDVTVTNCIGRNNVEGINFRNGATRGAIVGGSYHTNTSKNVLCEGGGEITATGVTAYASGLESFHARYAGSKITATNCLSYGSGTVDASAGMGYNAREGGSLTLINCIGHSNGRYSVQSWDSANNVVILYHCTFYNDLFAVNIASGTFTMKNCALSTFGWGSAIYIQAAATATLDYNVYHSGGWHWKGTDYAAVADYRTASGQDAHCVVDNPDFVTPGTNFHLLAGSPCIAAGDPAVGVLTDYDGVTRGAAVDCGAYEYV